MQLRIVLSRNDAYEEASRRIRRKDVLTGYDELYSYDGLYRLTDQKRGTLNGTQTAITSATFEQQWGEIQASLISPFQGLVRGFCNVPGALPQAFTSGPVGAGRVSQMNRRNRKSGD